MVKRATFGASQFSVGHLFERSLRRGGFRRLDRVAFSARAAAIPSQFDMKPAPVRRAECLDHRVLRRSLSGRLQFLLQHRLWIGRRRRDWISVSQLLVQGTLDKPGRGFQSSVQKNCAGNRFKDVGQQGMLAAATTLLFSPPEADKVTQTQFSRSSGEGRRADQPVLHARKLAFIGLRISPEEIVRNNQTQNRVTEELKRFVMQMPSGLGESWRHLLVRPRAVRHRLRQQIRIAKSIADYLFQRVRFFQCGCVHLSDSSKTPNTASK